jgi:hypothetical protein
MTIANRLSFRDPEDITLPSEDGQSMRLHFTVAPSGAAGARAPSEKTTEHELVIRLSGSRARSWGLDAARGRAVILHAAIERIFETARHREFPPSDELRIDDDTFPGSLPEHFDRPMNVGGSIIEVERAGNPPGLAKNRKRN